MTAPDQDKRKKLAMAEVRAVEEILRRWDPIGVLPGIADPLDEYNSYALHIVTMVKVGAATTTDLAAHLEQIAAVTMGLCPNETGTQHNLEIAAELIDRLRSRSGDVHN